MSSKILALADHLVAQRVSLVVMEATGDYWKPFYYLLAETGLEVMLVNPRQARQIPGRKTDVADSVWLADLAAHGLLRGSFVPPKAVRELKDLVRTRTTLARLRGQGHNGWRSCSNQPRSNSQRQLATSSDSPAAGCWKR